MKNFDIVLVISIVIIISFGMGCILLYMVNDRLSNIHIPKSLVIESAKSREQFDGDLNGEKIELEYEKSRLVNPDDRDVVEYEKNVCLVNNYEGENLKNSDRIFVEPQIVAEKIPAPSWPNETCKRNIERKILEKESKINIIPDQTCGNPKKIGQMENYYKIHRAYPSELVGGGLKGYNISNFSTAANIMDVGKINLNDAGEYAQPQNFVF